MTLDQQIQVWNAVGTWVAGLGTLAAVITSLWLVRRAERVDLRVVTTLTKNALYPELAGELTTSITNASGRTVRVKGIYWEFATTSGRKRGRTIGARPVEPVWVDLEYADSVTIDTGDFGYYMQHLDQASDWRARNSLRICVDTPLGCVAREKPSNEVIEYLVERQKKETQQKVERELALAREREAGSNPQ